MPNHPTRLDDPAYAGREWLVTEEFAAVTGLGRDTCYRAVRDGLVRSYTLGGRRIRIPKSEARRLLEQDAPSTELRPESRPETQSAGPGRLLRTG